MVMRSPGIQRLIDAVEAAYGSVALYGSDPAEEHGTCFTLAGVPATFSVHTRDISGQVWMERPADPAFERTP